LQPFATVQQRHNPVFVADRFPLFIDPIDWLYERFQNDSFEGDRFARPIVGAIFRFSEATPTVKCKAGAF
jgi:hypothetical protein